MHIFSFLFDRHLDKTVLAIAVTVGIVLLSLGEETRVAKARAVKAILLEPIDRISDHFERVKALEADNETLKAAVATLYHERERLIQFREERDRLRSLLGLREDPLHSFLSCEVIGYSSSPFVRSVTVDRGSEDGVRIGMAVAGYRGLVGTISQVHARSSEVMLIANRSVSVSCINKRSRVVGMLEWQRGNQFRLEYVAKEEDIIAGDTLLTSGFGKLFPKGFPVGIVTRVTDDKSGIGKRVDVRSLADMSALEELFIVIGTRGKDDEKLYDELENLNARRRQRS